MLFLFFDFVPGISEFNFRTINPGIRLDSMVFGWSWGLKQKQSILKKGLLVCVKVWNYPIPLIEHQVMVVPLVEWDGYIIPAERDVIFITSTVEIFRFCRRHQTFWGSLKMQVLLKGCLFHRSLVLWKNMHHCENLCTLSCAEENPDLNILSVNFPAETCSGPWDS